MVAADARGTRVLRGRAVLALAGLGVAALFALAALLVGGHFADAAPRSDDAAATVSSIHGEPDQALPVVHALRQQASTRARLAAFVVLAAGLLVASAASRRALRSSSRAPHHLRVGGRPPGRAPPRLRIA